MELLPLSLVRPSIQLLSTTLSAHFHCRPHDGFLPTFTDLIFTASNVDHPDFPYNRFARELQAHFHLPRPSLTAPAYANLVRGDAVGAEPAPSTLAAVTSDPNAALDVYRPIVVALPTVRKLLLAIQSLPDNLRAERSALEYILVSQHLMERKEFDHVASGLGYTPATAVTMKEDNIEPESEWRWWVPVASPRPGTYDPAWSDEEQGRDWKTVIDVEWKDKPTLWGLAAQLRQRPLAEVMVHAFNLADHDLESSPMQSNVVAQQRVLSYLCSTTTIQTPKMNPYVALPTVPPEDAGTSPRTESSSRMPRCVPFLCRPLPRWSSSLMLLQHFLGEDTAWRWCAEAFLHLQTGRVAKAGATNTVVVGEGGNSSIAAGASANSPTADPLQAGGAGRLGSDGVVMTAGNHASDVMSSAAGGGSSVNFLRVGSVYSTSLFLAGITKHWPEDILPPELLASTASSPELLGTAACADYFVTPTMTMLFEMAGILYQLRPKTPIFTPPGEAPTSIPGDASKTKSQAVVPRRPGENSAERMGTLSTGGSGATALIPRRVRHALVPVLRQTLWYFHTQAMMDNVANLYLFDPQWVNDFSPLHERRPWLETPSSEAEERITSEGEMPISLLAHLQQQYRWKAWVEHHLWLFPMLLSSARHQLSATSVQVPDPLYTVPANTPDGETAVTQSSSSSPPAGGGGAAQGSSTFVLPPPPKPTILSVSAAAALSLETLLSGLLSAVMLWQRSLVFQEEAANIATGDTRHTHTDSASAHSKNNGTVQAGSLRTAAVASRPLAEAARPFLRRIVAQYLPPPPPPQQQQQQQPRSVDGSLQRLRPSNWKYRHVVYLLAILNTMLFPLESSLLLGGAALHEGSRGVKAYPTDERKGVAKADGVSSAEQHDGGIPAPGVLDRRRGNQVHNSSSSGGDDDDGCGIADKKSNNGDVGEGNVGSLEDKETRSEDDGTTLISRYALVYPEMAPLLQFCSTRLRQAEREQNYLQERAASRDIALLLLYASELLQSDIEELCVCVRLPRGAQQARQRERAKRMTVDEKAEGESPVSSQRRPIGSDADSSAPLQGIYDTCWSIVQNKAPKGGFTTSALERLLHKANVTMKSDAGTGGGAKRSSECLPSSETISALEKALQVLPSRTGRPLYAV